MRGNKKENKEIKQGGSPGLVVMGDGSCSRGHGFEYRRCLLDGHDIFHIDLLKKLYCLFEKTENKRKIGLKTIVTCDSSKFFYLLHQ